MNKTHFKHDLERFISFASLIAKPLFFFKNPFIFQCLESLFPCQNLEVSWITLPFLPKFASIGLYQISCQEIQDSFWIFGLTIKKSWFCWRWSQKISPLIHSGLSHRWFSFDSLLYITWKSMNSTDSVLISAEKSIFVGIRNLFFSSFFIFSHLFQSSSISKNRILIFIPHFEKKWTIKNVVQYCYGAKI